MLGQSAWFDVVCAGKSPADRCSFLNWATNAVAIFLCQGFVMLCATVGILADVGRGCGASGDELFDDFHREQIE